MMNGTDLLAQVSHDLGIDLSALVARCAIWADPGVFHQVARATPHGAWYPNTRRIRPGERRGTMDGDVRLDDNTLANIAIKQAVFARANRDCKGFHVCHVWPSTCYDPRYHTSLANLVLLPAALAGLYDHDTGIAALLQFRAYDLFNWHPLDLPGPACPPNYPPPSGWAPTVPPSPAVVARIRKRLIG